MGDPCVKATPVNALVSYVRRELTPEQYKAVLASLPPDQARLLSGELLASELVPLPVVNTFTKAAAGQKGQGVEAFAHGAGRFGADLGLKTVYKFIMALLSPQSVLRAAPMMWKKVYDSGTILVETGDTDATIRVRDFLADPAGCGRITGWFEVIAERSTKGSRTRHVTCKARGDAECAWEFHWSA
jgi:hypothetical protein